MPDMNTFFGGLAQLTDRFPGRSIADDRAEEAADRADDEAHVQMQPVAGIMSRVQQLTNEMAALCRYHHVSIDDTERMYENAQEWCFSIQKAIRS